MKRFIEILSTLFLVAMIVLSLIGIVAIIAKVTENEDKMKLKDHKIYDIEIWITGYPYNAVPNDTLPDTKAFELARDVARSIKPSNPSDSVNVKIIVPVGNYIIDRTYDGKNTNFYFQKEHAVLNFNNPKNMTVSNMNITLE